MAFRQLSSQISGTAIRGTYSQIKIWPSLKQATFLLEEKQITEHDCEQVVLQTYEVREDLRKTALESPDLILWDGSSFMKHEVHKSGYAMVTLTTTLESSSLSLGTSAQLAQLIALTRALKLSDGRE